MAILLLMSDTARDYQTIESASLNGLDDLFDGSDAQADSDSVRVDTEYSSDKDSVTDIYWTPQEAAAFFGVSVRTIRRRLQDGTLDGSKMPGPNGLEWRVNPVARTDKGSVRVDVPDSSDKDSVRMDTTDSSDKDSVTVQSTETTALADKLFDYLREKDELLLSKDKDLQAASATIGYLKAQIEAQDQQLKLLTDSQHKGGWWAKFSSWFFKGK